MHDEYVVAISVYEAYLYSMVVRVPCWGCSEGGIIWAKTLFIL